MSISGVSNSTTTQQTTSSANYDQQIETLEKQIESLQNRIDNIDTDQLGAEQIAQALQAQVTMLQAQMQELQQLRAVSETDQQTQQIPSSKVDTDAQDSANTMTGGHVDMRV